MYRGFNVDMDGFDLDDLVKYEKAGREVHSKNKAAIRSKLDSFKDKKGDLLASEIVADWFPLTDADVFLSHSHKDSNLVIQISGWLREKFGLTSFIDSCIWGYSEDLLKIVDDEYCYQKDKGTYSYEKRNKSTAHIYMMLSTALIKMLDNCECIFFINTPHSISPKAYIETEGTTDSPWIYSEIAMTSLVQKRSPQEHRERVLIKAGLATEAYDHALQIKYDVDLTHLARLTADNLLNWQQSAAEKGAKSLDKLYALV
ncbi:hypothetical protein [Burkholderia contaminans]|uniref:hypothetical protein n=1 Tax=Burkholderia contaminans TaxID=488447 RepID=UPI001CF2BCDE|nr:hypothetical protein [Burkholderia contaminans]MCA8100987.1 hypothetical protein [Burkholderia contaminans]